MPSNAKVQVYKQIDGQIIKMFPAHIIYKIQNVINVIPISIESQQQLGRYFSIQDSLASDALREGMSPDKLVDFYSDNSSVLKELLSDLEFNDYLIVKRDQPKISELREIVKLREDLRLKDSQIQVLLKKIDFIENPENKENKMKVNFHFVDSLLSKNTHMLFYKLQNEENARKATEKHINDLLKNEFIHQEDSLREAEIIHLFELNRLATNEYWKSSGNDHEYKKNDSIFNENQPESLHKLNRYKAIPWWIIGKSFLDNKKEIGLSMNQITSIIDIAHIVLQEIERRKEIKFTEDFNNRSYEYSLLLDVVTREQMDKYLLISKNRDSKDIVKRYMPDLEKYNLVDEQNKKDVENQLFKYSLRLQIAREWTTIDNSKENLLRERNITDNKPAILKELDEEKRKERESRIVRF